ncbi:molybdate ABC transporter permease subunit [Bacillus alveayuensis]|jgi:molybdate transport system permease protein|uniref:molybdate ABC transporter permease subunit n=1 Tax=Aeribacillus alveayuensis TaxID=279215 RepID=UPI0005D0E984|nr:molybdate ABC transporter permease subunit [Bacillus alveayuensis]
MTAQFWSPVLLSMKIAFVSAFFVLIVGVIFARLMARKTFKGKEVLETIFLLPIVLPPSVVGFLLIIIFGKNSLFGQWVEQMFNHSIMFTWWAGVIAATVVAFPLMYQSAKSGFAAIDPGIEEASRVDGASEWKVFLYISIPLAMKAIISGFVLSFARALGEFGATLMFAGNIPGKTQTVSTAIYVAMDSGNMDLAWLWVLTVIVISFLMLVFIQWVNKDIH